MLVSSAAADKLIRKDTEAGYLLIVGLLETSSSKQPQQQQVDHILTRCVDKAKALCEFVLHNPSSLRKVLG